MLKTDEESKVDVLIVGAGPSGLMAALWMSHLGIKTRIVDKHSTGVLNGHADGLHPRTLELFDSFGIANRILRHAAPTAVFNSWALDDNGDLHRSERTKLDEGSGSRFTGHILHQGDIERLMLDAIIDSSDIKVERATLPISLKLDNSQAEDPDAYPIRVELKHLKDDEVEPRQILSSHALTKNGRIPESLRFESTLGRASLSNPAYGFKGPDGATETLYAKYMIGCDGAHSWTRRQLGFEMEGETQEMAWGVMDIIPITDFPDVHLYTTIQSKAGSFLFIPRENNLVRMYVQMGAVKRDGKKPYKITPEDILATAQKILVPFTLRYTYCDWWTVYQVGQRVANHYSASERIFLAGDAVHTHTPKGGQGMNVSMHDTYNLGWKLGGVINGQLPRSILKTYEAERRPVAQRLIAWDKELSRVYSGITNNVVHQTYMRNMQFLSGVGITYKPSVLVSRSLDLRDSLLTDGLQETDDSSSAAVVAKQHLASNAILGKRFPSHEVMRQSDWRSLHFQNVLANDGRWRLIVFGGDVLSKSQMDRLNVLGEKLAVPTGILKRYALSREGLYPIQVILLHSADRGKVELSEFHSTFFPFNEDEGYDYGKIYSDAAGAAHAFYGVDSTKGCLVVTRPDQHVGYVGELEDLDNVAQYFDGILVQHA